MKTKTTLGITLLLATVSFAFAGKQDSQPAAAPPQVQTISGYLVDVSCATDFAAKPKPGELEKHDKECLQMPDCAASGYSVVTADNKVIKFDKQSDASTKKLIADSNKKDNWKVTVTGVVAGDTITVQSLTLQP